MKTTTRRWTVIASAAATAAIAGAFPGWAFVTVTVSGTPQGSASSTSLGAPTISTSSVTSTNVTISVTSAPSSGPTPTSYRVARTAPTAVTTVCTITASTGNCSDASPASGQTNTYQVFAEFSSWEALPANAPTTSASVPTSVKTPSTPVLLAADDSGVSSTDGITNVTKPHFTGTGGTAGNTISLFFDGSTTANGTGTVAANGTWSVAPTTTLTSSGTTGTSHSVMAKESTGATFSSASGSLAFTVDTTAPAASPSGSATKYTYTDNASPTADTMTGSQGTVAAGDYLEAQITAPAASAGSYYSAAATSNGSLPAFNLANVVGVSAGTSVSITFYEVDVAGNRNATSVAQTFVDRS